MAVLIQVVLPPKKAMIDEMQAGKPLMSHPLLQHRRIIDLDLTFRYS